MTKLLGLSFFIIGFFISIDAQSPQQYETYLPVVFGQSQNKAGVAFSSHVDGEKRVSLLNGTVSYWRGWQVSSSNSKWGLEGVPNLWCDLYARTGITTTLVSQLDHLELLGEDYDGYLLFLNEPDLTYYGHHGQCEVTPYRAAQIYQHVKSTMPNVKLVGPGIHNIDYTHDFEWLGLFWDAVVSVTGSPPQMYAWDIHNYLQSGDPLAPYNSLEIWLQNRGVNDPIFWVSEWSSSSPERVIEMKLAFDGDPRIQRHYFYDAYKAWWDPVWIQEMTLYRESEDGIELSDSGIGWVSTQP